MPPPAPFSLTHSPPTPTGDTWRTLRNAAFKQRLTPGRQDRCGAATPTNWLAQAAPLSGNTRTSALPTGRRRYHALGVAWLTNSMLATKNTYYLSRRAYLPFSASANAHTNAPGTRLLRGAPLAASVRGVVMEEAAGAEGRAVELRTPSHRKHIALNARSTRRRASIRAGAARTTSAAYHGAASARSIVSPSAPDERVAPPYHMPAGAGRLHLHP